ncbi:hypothetical protein [Dechloromonas denitrificans]|uniref:hypothetical protein n=1 Tax=Dechloromonas denitrificans TaxID=281362 RepID=UPI001CF884C7|nr:hypothetical protein [Dechloromonas denitrificans]UCV05464.1 hypothetical protein KI611_09535 [Dechloromonas denitrificans]UCV09810.1 hypothetical protein KI615_09970 [Dechloromonas denitrificans]
MKAKQRWLIIGGLLLATLAAAYMAEDEAPAATGKRQTAAPAGQPRRAAGPDKLAETAAPPLSFPEPAAGKGEEGEVIDPFRNKSWYVAPPPPPPPKPTAPPLPFQYLGKLSEDGETRVFLNHQGKHLIAKVGDVINGTYSVEDIAGGQMIFRYQPLQETQTLAIGSER